MLSPLPLLPFLLLLLGILLLPAPPHRSYVLALSLASLHPSTNKEWSRVAIIASELEILRAESVGSLTVSGTNLQPIRPEGMQIAGCMHVRTSTRP